MEHDVKVMIRYLVELVSWTGSAPGYKQTLLQLVDTEQWDMLLGQVQQELEDREVDNLLQ